MQSLTSGQNAMNNLKLITELIHSSKGYSHEVVGMIIGFFDDPEQARRCADDITVIAGKKVDVCGSRLSLSL
jgi:hypothetical protein